MRHPFDGINEPVDASRRTWLGMLAALAGFFGFSSLVNAAAPPNGRVRVTNPVPDPNPEPPATPPVATTAIRVTAKDAPKEALREVTYRKGESGGLPTTLGEREEGG